MAIKVSKRQSTNEHEHQLGGEMHHGRLDRLGLLGRFFWENEPLVLLSLESLALRAFCMKDGSESIERSQY